MKIEMEKSQVIRDPANNYSSKTELAYNGSRENLDPYIPAEHRPIDSNTSSLGALAHLLKASLGFGVLAMPAAYKSSGLLLGFIGTLLVGFICTHAIHIIVRTSQQLCVELKRPFLGYADTCDLVFQHGPKRVRAYAPYIRELADGALAVTHLGVCCVYVVLIADSVKKVLDVYGAPDLSIQIYCASTLPILIPLTQITTLKYLVPFSALANFAWLASISICVWYCLTDTVPLSTRPLANSITGLPLFISTSLFAMEGIGVVMPIENEMTEPSHFLGCPGVLSIAMSAVSLLYAFVGFTGYWKYGDAVEHSLTLSLPQQEIPAQIATILVAAVIVLSYTLVYYVPVDVVWRRLESKVPASSHRWAIAGIRLVGALLTVFLAIVVPKLDFFIDLVGAVCLSMMGLLLPAVVETTWLWDKSLGVYKWRLWKNLLIIIFSVIALITGVVSTLLNMINGHS